MIRAYPVRALMLWLALHIFLFVVSGGDILALGTRATLVLAAIGAVVGRADTSRRHEYGLLGNLGIPKHAPAAIWAATMIVVEIALRLAASLAGITA